MTIYAKQVPPEYQESPIDFYDWPEDVFVFGNRAYTAHAGRLEGVRQGLERIAESFDDMQHGVGWCHDLNLHALIWYEIPRDDGRSYSRTERLELVQLAQKYCDCKSSEENGVLCRVLELITGRKWSASVLRGCCQGDWQEIIYPAEYGQEWLQMFETEYFNTGDEWQIYEGGAGSNDYYYFYTHGWSDESNRAEIAAEIGVDPDDVVLCKFAGWSRSACYEEFPA